ncbi:hypothetical protein C8Q76DRAFT_747910 [Earliella scabrosa]|nr:hypothetical protein C8Q76DRAFT_747910 [Earliella scabrosa]
MSCLEPFRTKQLGPTTTWTSICVLSHLAPLTDAIAVLQALLGSTLIVDAPLRLAQMAPIGQFEASQLSHSRTTNLPISNSSPPSSRYSTCRPALWTSFSCTVPGLGSTSQACTGPKCSPEMCICRPSRTRCSGSAGPSPSGSWIRTLKGAARSGSAQATPGMSLSVLRCPYGRSSKRWALINNSVGCSSGPTL